jgi:uncharacterized surface protein with fasciclin (FAS1) repeats
MTTTLTGGLVLAALLSVGLVPNANDSKPSCAAPSADARSDKQGKTIVDTAVGAGNFKTLVQALQAANLVDTLKGPGPFTVFAPSDEAFAKLPEGTLANLLKPENAETLKTILTYHVVSGDVRAEKVVGLKSAAALNGQRIAIRNGKEGVSVAGARVVKTDIACSNGVIHVLDQVMMPATKDLVATAVDAGKFTILAQALGAAELVETLSDGGPFTVFAPTDEAFRKLPKETLDSLLRPENKEKLAAILKYHVIEGRVYSDQLANGSVMTVGGTKLMIEVQDGTPRIAGAGVQKADLETINGVIHVIDQVLIPGA